MSEAIEIAAELWPLMMIAIVWGLWAMGKATFGDTKQ